MTTSSSTPPPSSLQRALELDLVRDVMLLENQEHMKVDPIPAFQGDPAPRARLEAQLRTCRAATDQDGERVLSLELARIHFENAFDVDMAVQLLHRALEIVDDAELRVQLAHQLTAMGRHIEAGHVLRDGEPADAIAVFNAWLESGEAYARGGDAQEAVSTFRESAMIAPDDALPFARIAAVACWAGNMVPKERAADAWLEAAKRQAPGSIEHFTCVLRAFEVAPSYARSAETYTTLLQRTGRAEEADEIWRVYALASGHVEAVSVKRVGQALGRGDMLNALSAALEHTTFASEQGQQFDALHPLSSDERVLAWLQTRSDDGGAAFEALRVAATKPDRAERAEGLEACSRELTGDARALLLTFAAEARAAAGEDERAVAMIRRARTIAPWVTRAHSALFGLRSERTTIPDLEGALGYLPATSKLHEQLAQRWSEAGEHDLALAHRRRVVDLRPGALSPLVALLETANTSRDIKTIVAAVTQVLESPRPWRDLAPALAQSLATLHELDPRTCLDVAGQLMSTIGPGRDELYDCIRRIAAAAEDGVLDLATTLGHAIGDEIDDEERAAIYLESADLSLSYGDVEAAAVHVSRAAAHSGRLEDLLGAIERVRSAIGALDPPARSDARISLLRAAAWAAEQQDLPTSVAAWRKLGAARWDLADDLIGAEEAFFVACSIDPETGPYRYARDLGTRLGSEAAVPRIVERAVNAEHEGSHPKLVARLYAAGAMVAAEAGMVEAAMDAAVAAVRTDPSRADAVAIVESLAEGDSGMQALNFVYDTLADAALGKYGFRAAHYRAARQLEKHAALDDALRHAISAFEAVPSVGASYAMLLRLAARAGNEAAAVGALTTASAAMPIEGQVAWLVRAAEVAAKSGVESELQLELLLKAFSLAPSAELVDRLGAIAGAIHQGEADVEHMALVTDRLERAALAALSKLDVGEAEVALSLAVMAGDVLQRPSLTCDATCRAVELDRHDVDYSLVLPFVADMAGSRTAAQRLLEQVNDARAAADRPLAPGLQELMTQLYLGLSEIPSAASQPAGEVAEEVLGIDPPQEPGVDEVGTDEEASVDSGEVETARPPEEHPSQQWESEAVFDAHFDAIEADDGRASDPTGIVKVTLKSQPPASEPAEAAPAPPAREPRVAQALDYSPASEAAARRRGDHAAIARMLAARIAETDNPEKRRLIRLRRAAVLEQRLNRIEDACKELEMILQEVGEDPTALRYLADLSERSGYHARGAKLWLRASQKATDIDEKIRDVVRCCEALVAAGRVETAGKLLDAARGLPQSPKLLRLRIAVARRLGDRPEVERAKLELEAFDGDSEMVSISPFESLQPAADAVGDDALRVTSEAPDALDEAVARLADESGAERPRQRDSTIVSSQPQVTPPVRPSNSPPVSNRGVFRVTGAPPDEDGERTPHQVLQDCHELYLEHGTGGPREAKRAIRRLRPVADLVEGDDKDLYTFLLVEALDAAQGTGAANHALQQHWETLGGTPLVTLAVADRLVRRGDLRPALQLYRRVMDRDLRGVRSRGRVALDAGAVAWRLDDADGVQGYLDIAADDPTTAELAAKQRDDYAAGIAPPSPATTPGHEPFTFHFDPASALREPSRIKTDGPRASSPPPPPDSFDELDDDDVEATDVGESNGNGERNDDGEIDASITPVTDDELEANQEIEDAVDILDDDLEELDALDEDGTPSGRPSADDVHALDPGDDDVLVATSMPPPSDAPASSRPPSPSSFPPAASSRPPSVEDRHSYPPGHQRVEHITSIPPAPSRPPQIVSVVRRIPTFPELAAPNEEQLFDDLLSGDVDAGNHLVALFGKSRTHDVLSVRRYQATLQRGNVHALCQLRDAAVADRAGAFARAIEHVISVFDTDAPAEPAVPLNALPAQPDNTKKLLFSWLDGTVNDALSIVSDSGMFRRELADYDLTGADRVPPVATTAVGRVYAALTRLLDLGVRLFHRNRTSTALRSDVALVSPLSAVLAGKALDEGPELNYVVASALAAATPFVALVEGLEELQVRDIVSALRAGFGPVEEHSVTTSSPAQMRIAEDLWHMVPAASDRRLRTICRDTYSISYEIAVANAESTRRRAGLFGCGDLVVAIRQTQRELDLPARGLTPDALRELCQHPAIADLYDLSILPEYAESRWTA
jgi:tetratricopeptide (TPR) repeat protein